MQYLHNKQTIETMKIGNYNVNQNWIDGDQHQKYRLVAKKRRWG